MNGPKFLSYLLAGIFLFFLTANFFASLFTHSSKDLLTDKVIIMYVLSILAFALIINIAKIKRNEILDKALKKIFNSNDLFPEGNFSVEANWSERSDGSEYENFLLLQRLPLPESISDKNFIIFRAIKDSHRCDALKFFFKKNRKLESKGYKLEECFARKSGSTIEIHIQAEKFTSYHREKFIFDKKFHNKTAGGL